MNRHDEKDWRSDRDRHYGFREDEESARTAGDEYQQPYSQNPYGYYPGQRSSGQRMEQQREIRLMLSHISNYTAARPAARRKFPSRLSFSPSGVSPPLARCSRRQPGKRPSG